MKKSVFLLGTVSVLAAVQFFAPVVSAAVGSWSVNGNNMYYNDGSVLVGATTPIKNGTNIQSTANDYNVIGVTSHHEVGNPSFIGYRSRGTNLSPLPVAKDDFVGGLLGRGHDGTDYRNAAGIRFQVAENPSASNMPGNISFWTRGVDAANFEEKMRLSHTGNLGIGTNSPEKIVHAYKQGGGEEIRIQSDAVTYGMGINAVNNAGFLFTRTNHPIYFGTNNNRLMTLSESGNVGIGDANPQYKLTVQGSVCLGQCQPQN